MRVKYKKKKLTDISYNTASRELEFSWGLFYSVYVIYDQEKEVFIVSYSNDRDDQMLETVDDVLRLLKGDFNIGPAACIALGFALTYIKV